MKIVIAISLIIFCSGCASVGKRIADGVDRYCKEPQQTRYAVRAEVNEYLADDGHSIQLNCRQDN